MSGVIFGVAPSEADWYYCAVVNTHYGETDYVDGYATGDEPTVDALRESMRCEHSWVAGMCYVSTEDIPLAIEEGWRLECERCDSTYANRDALPRLDVLEWQVSATPRGQHAEQGVSQ